LREINDEAEEADKEKLVDVVVDENAWLPDHEVLLNEAADVVSVWVVLERESDSFLDVKGVSSQQHTAT